MDMMQGSFMADFDGLRNFCLSVMQSTKDIIVSAKDPSEAAEGYDQIISLMDMSLKLIFKEFPL